MNGRSFCIPLVFIVFLVGCKPEPIEIVFEDQEDLTIVDYLEENQGQFSSFIEIITKGDLKDALSAYNPFGDGFTLFLPDNHAIDNFIQNDSRFNTLDNLLDDASFCHIFSRYHVVNLAVISNDFPFGAFSEQTLSGDLLTVSFVIGTDSSFYKINNNATVTKTNIEVSNGIIHQIESALSPVTFSSFEWLKQHSQFSVFTDAVDITGLDSLIDFNLKEYDNREAVTVLAEPDSIFNKIGIQSINDLIEFISPEDDNYTSESNPLNLFISYHFLKGNLFIDDFVDVSTVYSTYSDVPLNINGTGLDIAINKGKQVFDTIIQNTDTTFIDFIKFIYDESNVITQSGAVHFIDRMMTRQSPSRTIRTFQFFEEPALNEYRSEGGSYLLEDPDVFKYLDWSGAELFFVKLADEETSALNGDYLEINGDFEITYRLPEIVQGSYDVFLRAEAFNNENALIEVFIDGKKLGGLIDLSTGGSPSNPFQNIELGKFDIKRYSEHIVEIRPLIPGRFLWDHIRFEPA